MQIQEAQRVPIKMNPKRFTPRNIIIKIAKFKDKENTKGSKWETHSNIQGSPDKAITKQKHDKPEGKGKKYSK